MKYILPLFVSFGLIFSNHINTGLSYSHMATMGSILAFAVIIPFLVIGYGYKEKIIHFHWKGKAKLWDHYHIAYIFFAVTAAYLLLPFYFKNTGAHLNWEVPLDPSHITRLFVGINGVGIWDELFFINTLLAIFGVWFRFPIANVLQAVCLSLFLYKLGFTGWGALMTFPFAIIQGMVYRQTQSLSYVIITHLLIDLILFLALINAHHPEVLNIFITN